MCECAAVRVTFLWSLLTSLTGTVAMFAVANAQSFGVDSNSALNRDVDASAGAVMVGTGMRVCRVWALLESSKFWGSQVRES